MGSLICCIKPDKGTFHKGADGGEAHSGINILVTVNKPSW